MMDIQKQNNSNLISEQINEEDNYIKIAELAAKNGELDIFKFVMPKITKNIKKQIIRISTEKDQLNIIKYIAENFNLQKDDFIYIAELASIDNSYNVLIYAYEIAYPFNMTGKVYCAVSRAYKKLKAAN